MNKIFSLNSILMLALAIVLFMFLKQCHSGSEAEQELARMQRNLIAANDSIRYIKSEEGRIIAEKSGLQLKVSELNSEQKEIMSRLELEKKKTPGVIIRTVIEYRDTGISVETHAKANSDSTGDLSFAYSLKLKGKNSLKVSGKVPYLSKIASKNISGEDVFYSTVTGNGNTTLEIQQTLDVVAGLYKDPKTEILQVRLSTDFPGITFGALDAIEIQDNAETKRALKSARKNFGIGFQLGYGFGINKTGYTVGPYVGLGLHYSPKFLQF
jgi:hypothetical protein